MGSKGSESKSKSKAKNRSKDKKSDGKPVALKKLKSTESTEVKRAKKTSKASKTSKLKKSSEPQTMEELLAQTGYKLYGLKKGEAIEGVINDIGKKKLLIDIGAKTEGVILGKELERVKDFVSTLKVGDKIKVIVGMPENERGQILLSLRQAAEDYKWNLFDKYLETEEEIEVRGLDINRGGMIARVMDVYGFVPVSQFGRKWLGKLEKLYNKLFKVKVIEVDRTKNRLIFSEKAVSEAKALAAQEEALKKVKAGDVLQGMVSGIMPFGIFVRVNIEGEEKKRVDKVEQEKAKSVKGKKEDSRTKDLFLEGLVHISEISWEKVGNLNELYKIGETVKVKVLGIDKNSSRLNLSVKQLKTDPWTDLAKKYPADKKFRGTVTKLVAFGAFVALEPGVEGLIHISKVPVGYEMKVGKKVDVFIENIDLEQRRIALGLVLAKKPVGYK